MIQDYRINAEVRRYLVSRWVDVEHLQLGATNGVVYIMGRLDTTLEDPQRTADEKLQRNPTLRVLQLAQSLERDLRRIRDVRDVVFKLSNVFKRGGRWRAMDGSSTAKYSRSRVSLPGDAEMSAGARDGDIIKTPRTWTIASQEREGTESENEA